MRDHAWAAAVYWAHLPRRVGIQLVRELSSIDLGARKCGQAAGSSARGGVGQRTTRDPGPLHFRRIR